MAWLAILTMACSSGADSDGSAESSGTAKGSSNENEVRIAGSQLENLPRWVISSTPGLTIGLAEGDEPYLLTRVQAAGRLPMDEIFIAENSTRELRVYNSEGRFRRRFGGKGAGPGEFQAWQVISAIDSTRVSIYDPVLQRVTIYDLLQGLVSTESAPRSPCERKRWTCDVEGILATGEVVYTRTRRSSASKLPVGELVVTPGPTRHYDLRAPGGLQFLDSLPGLPLVRLVGEGRGPNVPYWATEALFASRGVLAFGARSIALGQTDDYAIHLRDQQGKPAMALRVETPRIDVTQAMIDRLRTWAKAADVNEHARAYLDHYEPTGSVPFFGDLAIDRAGRLWIQDYLPPRPLAPPPQLTRWTVFDTNGLPLARVEAGQIGSILEFGADYVLTVGVDDMGVHRVMLRQINGV